MKILLSNAKVRISKEKFSDCIGFDSNTGKIIFTGNQKTADKNEFDEITDLKQRLVIPSFTDGHCHFVEGSYINTLLDLRNARTKKDFERSILEYKKKNRSWIEGGFFAEANFTESIIPDRKFLDGICEDVPIIISRFDVHTAFANSKALEISGISGKAGEFIEEELIRDDSGELTGELKERAMDYVRDCIPEATLEERVRAVSGKMKEFHSFGITSISDITLPEDLEVYMKLLNDSKLKLKTDARLPFSEFANLKRYTSDFEMYNSIIKFNSFKAFYDGSLSSRTALMHSNYKNSAFNGIKTEFVKSGEFERTALAIDEAGYQMSVHAIGDKAVTDLLDFNEELIKINRARDRRFRIEHAQHITEKDFNRFKQLEVIASVQPAHLFSDAKTATEILEDPSIEHNYKKLYDDGVKVCFGTDFPIVSEDPFENIFLAMTRKAEGFKNGFFPENNFSLDECIDSYTINNAFASFDEKERGSLEVGKDADIVILEDDLFQMDAEEVRKAKVFGTYFRGERVY